jgi:hypothetical protein
MAGLEWSGHVYHPGDRPIYVLYCLHSDKNRYVGVALEAPTTEEILRGSVLINEWWIKHTDAAGLPHIKA